MQTTFGAFPLHGTVRYGSLLGGFPLGTVPGTFLVPPRPGFQAIRTVTKTWRVNSADHWLAGKNRHYCVITYDMTHIPARFKSAQPAKDRTQILFEQTHIFVSTKKMSVSLSVEEVQTFLSLIAEEWIQWDRISVPPDYIKYVLLYEHVMNLLKKTNKIFKSLLIIHFTEHAAWIVN